MAIGLGTVGNPVSSGGGQYINVSLTVAVGDLVVAYSQHASGRTPTAAFDGNGMSVLATTGTIFFGTRFMRAWLYQVTSATTANVTIDNGVAETFRGGAFVIQGGDPTLDAAAITEAINSNATSNTLTRTTVTADAWMFVLAYVTSGDPAASTGSTNCGSSANNMGAFYQGPIATPGSTDMVYTMPSSQTTAIAFAVKPAASGATGRSPIINVNRAVQRAASW